jgi:hypothetical protein
MPKMDSNVPFIMLNYERYILCKESFQGFYHCELVSLTMSLISYDTSTRPNNKTEKKQKQKNVSRKKSSKELSCNC